MMKSRTSKHTTRKIAELLESDDELPDSYDEIPEIPAYLNDKRFAKVDPVEYDSLYQRPADINLQTKLVQQQNLLSKEPVHKNSTTLQNLLQKKSKALVLEHNVRTLNNKKTLISKGVLTKRDLFLIKSIEEYATDTTLLWFIDFLNSKAMKRHQRSCLVAEVLDDYSSTATETRSDFQMRYYLQLVVN